MARYQRERDEAKRQVGSSRGRGDIFVGILERQMAKIDALSHQSGSTNRPEGEICAASWG